LGAVYQYQNDIQDLQEAVYWYQKAANNGYRSTKDKVRALNRQGYYDKLDQIGIILTYYQLYLF
jgi:TPR repeat protein